MHPPCVSTTVDLAASVLQLHEHCDTTTSNTKLCQWFIDLRYTQWKEAAYVDDSEDDSLEDLRLEREVDEILQFVFWEQSGEGDDREDELETDMNYDAY